MALNFPSNPSDGDTYENYVYEAARGVWKAVPASDYTLANLEDLNITSVSDGQGIVYDSTSSTWQNQDISVNIYDVDSTSTGYFDLPSGTSAERPASPNNGQIRFNTELGEPEYYSEAAGDWFLFREKASNLFELEYLVVAGGGGGGAGYDGAGGGAGGLRTSATGQTSGGGSSTQPKLSLESGTFSVTVGAGGAGATGGRNVSLPGTQGSSSEFYTISTVGGGGGSSYGDNNPITGTAGGSGGGGNRTTGGRPGTANEGFAGGNGITNAGGGGGGAAEPGNSDGGRQGGDGLSNNITGTTINYAGGGGAGGQSISSVQAGGVGGGGSGAAGSSTLAGNGTANTGGGGGGANEQTDSSGNAGSGGSGVVIIKYPTNISFTADPGLAYNTSVVTFAEGNFNVTQFTAGTGSVVLS